jgi:hypothetical protein
MQFICPLYNLVASITGNPGLPQTGAEIKMLYAAFISGSENVFATLLNQVYRDWSGKSYDYLSVGFCEGNELCSVASRYAVQRISSTVYIVHWQDERVLLPDASIPVHVEVATL